LAICFSRLPEVFKLVRFDYFDYRDLIILIILIILWKDRGWVVEGSFSSGLPINPASS
jgi:hypothetical protein